MEKHLGWYVGPARLHASTFTDTHMAEWVHQDRMLKWEEKNLAVQKTLMAEHRASTAKEREDDRRQERERRPSTYQPKELSSHKENVPPKESKVSKRESRAKKVEDEGYGTEIYNWNPPSKKRAEVKLIVPEILKAALVDDWEAVTKMGQVSHYKWHDRSPDLNICFSW
jgi:mortality factor 4-like protein 1